MTLSFQTRLILFSTVTFAALLAGLSATSYRLLKRQLDLDATADLAELATGLHGYLRFDGEAPTFAFDNDFPALAPEPSRRYSSRSLP